MSVSEARLRRSRTPDVRTIRRLIDGYAQDRILLAKETVTLYEDIQEFWIAENGDGILGCGALHVMWEDLAERSEEHTSELQSRGHLVCRLLLEKKKAAREC